MKTAEEVIAQQIKDTRQKFVDAFLNGEMAELPNLSGPTPWAQAIIRALDEAGFKIVRQ